MLWIFTLCFILQVAPETTAEDFIEDLNHDTITSLRHFVESAIYAKNKGATAAAASSSRSSSRTSSFSSIKGPRRPSTSAQNRCPSVNEVEERLRPQPQQHETPKAASVHGGDDTPKWKSLIPKRFTSNKSKNLLQYLLHFNSQKIYRLKLLIFLRVQNSLFESKFE